MIIGLSEFTIVTGGILEGYILYDRDGIDENLAWTVAWISFK